MQYNYCSKCNHQWTSTSNPVVCVWCEQDYIDYLQIEAEAFQKDSMLWIDSVSNQIEETNTQVKKSKAKVDKLLAGMSNWRFYFR